MLLFFCCVGPAGFTQVNVFTVTGSFNGSGGVKLGPDDHIYIADYGAALPNANGTQVWRFNPATLMIEEFANGLSGASGNDFDSQGNLFQSNIAVSLISKIDTQGNVTVFTSTGISNPVGIVIDDQDNLFVCNCGNNTIRKVTPAGVSTQFTAAALLSCPNGITRDFRGYLYVSNFNNGNVIRIDSSGIPSLLATVPGNNNGHITFSMADSLLYLASHGSSRIYRISLAGEVSVLAGSGLRGNQDGAAESASFSRPNGIAASSTGDTLYVNSSIPTTNVGLPLNPSVLRIITGVNSPAVGIEGQSPDIFNQLTVFPNPVREQLTIEASVSSPADIDIFLFSLEGKTVLEKQASLLPGNQQIKFQIERGIESGLYLLSFQHPLQSISRLIRIESP